MTSQNDDTNAVGAAEAEVGRYVYRRIAALMDAKAGTPAARELQFLSGIAWSIEEYGEAACADDYVGLPDLPNPFGSATDEGFALVPREPTEAMADKGAHCNSEWLNDGAPIGERRYREPAMAVWRTMLRVALGEDPRYGWKDPADEG